MSKRTHAEYLMAKAAKKAANLERERRLDENKRNPMYGITGELSDMFFNDPDAEQAYDEWCRAPELLAPPAKMYLMAAAQKFLSKLRMARYRFEFTPGQLADDFLARV